MVIEKMKERKIDMKIKYDLEEFKKVQAQFVVIKDQMHFGCEISFILCNMLFFLRSVFITDHNNDISITQSKVNNLNCQF